MSTTDAIGENELISYSLTDTKDRISKISKRLDKKVKNQESIIENLTDENDRLREQNRMILNECDRVTGKLKGMICEKYHIGEER